MATRPATYPVWVDSGPNVIQPPANLAATGWDPAIAPDAQHHNWLFGTLYDWIVWLDQATSTGIPNQVIRLLNGGLWSFVASSGVLQWSATANLAIPGVPDSSNAIAASSVTLADGQIAYCVANIPTQSLGSISLGSPSTIFNMNFTGNILFGMNVTGPGIQPGTTVTSVTATTVGLSLPATSNETNQTFTFSNAGPITVQVANNDTFNPNYATILLARRSGSVVYLGINSSQMLLRDGEFKPLLGSGYFDVYTAVAGENLTAGMLAYISPGPSDGGRTQGDLYKLDVSAANASVRGTFAGLIISTVTTGQTALVLYSGFYENNTVTPGLQYYADPATPGGITSLPPTGPGQKVIPIGIGVPFGFGGNTASLLVEVANGGSGVVPTYTMFFQEIIGFGNGSVTTFNTTQPVLNASSLFIYRDGLIVPSSEWGLSGNTVTFTVAPGIGVQIYAEYVLSNQVYLSAVQQIPTPVGFSTSVFSIAGNPINPAAIVVFVDGMALPASEWSLAIVGGQSQITLNTPLSPGQTIYSLYFLPVNPSAIEAHGSFAAPITITAAGGISPTPAQDQVWFVQSVGGAVPITANPQIAPGTQVGQRLKLKGVSASNYITLANGNGNNQNGSVNLTNNEAIEYTWDGTNWNEDFRRS